MDFKDETYGVHIDTVLVFSLSSPAEDSAGGEEAFNWSRVPPHPNPLPRGGEGARRQCRDALQAHVCMKIQLAENPVTLNILRAHCECIANDLMDDKMR